VFLKIAFQNAETQKEIAFLEKETEEAKVKLQHTKDRLTSLKAESKTEAKKVNDARVALAHAKAQAKVMLSDVSPLTASCVECYRELERLADAANDLKLQLVGKSSLIAKLVHLDDEVSEVAQKIGATLTGNFETIRDTSDSAWRSLEKSAGVYRLLSVVARHIEGTPKYLIEASRIQAECQAVLMDVSASAADVSAARQRLDKLKAEKPLVGKALQKRLKSSEFSPLSLSFINPSNQSD
jgi:chromosome segregation ATPase